MPIFRNLGRKNSCWEKPVSLFTLIFILFLISPNIHAATWVENGSARATILLPDDAQPVARFAAEELVTHIEKATGARLTVLSETQAGTLQGPRIFIGTTQTARDRGLPFTELAPDAFLLRHMGNDLFVTGSQDGTDPFRESAGADLGTLYGVYELIERVVGVRWLWPGELGTYVPRVQTLRLDEELDLISEPAFAFRRFRSHHIPQAIQNDEREASPLTFSKDVLHAYHQDLRYYKRRHRLGDTTGKPPVGHYFSGWWLKYGKQHPDWFAMDSQGRRGVPDDASDWNRQHVAMCVSNPELHRYIVEKAWDGGRYLRLGEVDRRIFCLCKNCRAWDGTGADQFPTFVRNITRPVVSDRYARFWQAVYDLAVKRNPDVVITTFLYWNYLPAPAGDFQFNGKLYGEFVPWGQDEITYWPISPQADAWVRAQWQGWAEKGVVIAHRPNYFHGGYVMPHLSTRQVGAFLQFAARHNMVGFDQDMLIGHWAVRGPMLYLHMRMAVNPNLSVEQIRTEYFQAFGPASASVAAYFDYWENYASERSRRDRDFPVTSWGVGSLYNPIYAHLAYPENVFDAAGRLLDQARSAAQASGQPVHLERVAFLEGGLKHARLSARFMKTLEEGAAPTDNASKMAKARAAIEDLIAFRRAHEHLYIADLVDASRREHRRIGKLETLLGNTSAAEVSPAAIPAMPLETWVFRQDSDNRGIQERWYSVDVPFEETWKPIAVPSFWDNTPFGAYEGYAWYRTHFMIPPTLESERLNIFFGGVDEQAWVYLNGQMIGEHTVASQKKEVEELWKSPFSIEIPLELLLSSKQNTLAVRVHNGVKAGGIWRPVQIRAFQELN